MDFFQNFQDFQVRYPDRPYENIKIFLTEEKEKYYQEKTTEYINEGVSQENIPIKVRQSWVSYIGRKLEKLFELLISEFCEDNGLSFLKDSVLRRTNLPLAESLVKRSISIDYGNHLVIPDGDIIIYKIENGVANIFAILSIKNSFRERYTETPYWKLKLLQNPITEKIKVLLVTPDNDNELSSNVNPRKARIVMEYELDGLYLANNEFDASDKVKSISDLIDDLYEIIK
jgi:type II restriction enzyme